MSKPTLVLLTTLALLTLAAPPVHAQTRLLGDLNPGPADSHAGNPYFTEFNGAVYFRAADDAHGAELWRTDGTQATRVTDVYPGSTFGVFLTRFAVFGSALYFSSYDNVHGVELGRYDGANVSIIDLFPGPSSSYPFEMTAVDDRLYFTIVHYTGRQLWSYDGATAEKVADVSVSYFASYQGQVIVAGDDGIVGEELWRFDGSTFSLLADIHPTGSSSPDGFMEHNGVLYFSADDGTHGRELWKYDGTTVAMVADIHPSGNSNPGIYNGVIPYGEVIVFNADDGTHGKELWTYDGTEARLAADLTPGPASSEAEYFGVLDGKLIGTAIQGWYLFSYDGHTTSYLSPYPFSSHPVLLDGKLYASGFYAQMGDELVAYDGTTLQLVADIHPTGHSSPSYLTAANGKVYFVADDGVHGQEIWVSDGGALLPVELASFTTVFDGNAVQLRWETASETNNAGFEVERKDASSGASWEPVGFVAGHGTTAATQTYEYAVTDVAPGRHAFRLRQIDFDGTVAYSPVVELEVPITAGYHLSGAYPNPSRGHTRLSLAVSETQHVTAGVYNLLGQRVALLYDGVLEGGATYPLTFEAGALPGGHYLVRVAGEHFSATRALTVLR